MNKSILYLLSQLMPGRVLAHTSVSAAQYQTLHLLSEHGALNLSDLAKFRGVKKSTMSVLMDQLLTNQLVLNAISKTDARQKLYLITNKGRTLYQEVTTHSMSRLRRDWSDYSDNEWQSCYSMLNTLIKPHDD